MAAPKPPAPSSRVVLAFFIATIIGGLMFAIWWVTGRQATGHPQTPGAQEMPAPKGPGLRTEDSNAVPRGGVLRGPADPDNAADTVALLTQATLVRVNRSTDQLEPWLAESWTSGNNNLTYILKLRPNILWSDGSAFTAADVALSLADARILGKPLTVRAVSAMEVELTLPGSFGPGLRLLDRMPILSVHGGLGPFVLTNEGAAGPKGTAGPKGLAGPKGAALRTFARNPHYWRTAPDGKALPYLDEIQLDAAADPGAKLKRLLDGDLDFIETELRPEDYTALKRADQEDRTRLYNLGSSLAADVLWINPAPGPKGPGVLSNETFRLAISTAVNRREFCDAVYLGACDPVFGPVTPGNPAWFLSDLSAAGPDPVLARAMLAGIGLHDRNGDGVLDDAAGRPVRLSLLVARGRASAERGAAFLRDQLKDVGIAVDVEAVDEGVLADRRKKGTYAAILDRLKFADTDPALNLDFWILPNAATDWEKRTNDMMLKQATSTDRVERVQLFADAQKLRAQHMPEIFLGAPYTYVATSLRVRNVKPSGRHPALLWNADQLAITGR